MTSSNMVSKVRNNINNINININLFTVAKEFLSDKTVIQLNYITVEKMGQKIIFLISED